MFCKNCGKEISDQSQFCIHCGTPVTHVQQAPAFVPQQTPVQQTPVFTQQSAPIPHAPVLPVPAKPKKSHKALIITIISIVVALAIGATVYFFMKKDKNKSTESGAKASSEGYITEVEDYLNFIKDKEDSAKKYISDAYLGGEFGYLYSGKTADAAHQAIYQEMLDETHMEGYLEEYDTWEDLFENNVISSFYEYMRESYGKSWKFNYKITNSEKVDDIEDCNDAWDELVENYDDSEITSIKKVKNLIKDIEDIEIKTAYIVDVEITISGEEDFEKDVDFLVVQAGNQWVILEGPSFYDFT